MYVGIVQVWKANGGDFKAAFRTLTRIREDVTVDQKGANAKMVSQEYPG